MNQVRLDDRAEYRVVKRDLPSPGILHIDNLGEPLRHRISFA
jgi:hypothetical protein